MCSEALWHVERIEFQHGTLRLQTQIEAESYTLSAHTSKTLVYTFPVSIYCSLMATHYNTRVTQVIQNNQKGHFGLLGKYII